MKTMLKTAAVVALGIATATSPILAADIYVPPPEAPYIAPAAYNWTGLYIGANAGWSWGNATADTPFDITINGGILGGQAGYNYMFANGLVVGVEGDIAWSGEKGSIDLGPNVTQSLNWLGTIRSRLGYGVGNWMPYLTGGFAVAGATRTSTIGPSSETKTHTGYVLGVGVEWAHAQNWTLNLGYQYVNLGAQTYTAIPADPSVSIVDHIVRIALNFKL